MGYFIRTYEVKTNSDMNTVQDDLENQLKLFETRGQDLQRYFNNHLCGEIKKNPDRLNARKVIYSD